MMEIIADKIAFESKEPYKGFTVRAIYLKEPNRDALIEIFKEGELHRQFLFPAYKIWNIAAHFNDIVNGELDGSERGYEMAAWDGISGATILMPDELLKQPEN